MAAYVQLDPALTTASTLVEEIDSLGVHPQWPATDAEESEMEWEMTETKPLF